MTLLFAMLTGCFDPERADCALSTENTSVDEPTALGSTARELAAPWDGRPFGIVWVEETPLPDAYSLDIDADTLTAQSIVWADDAGCPESPSVDVSGSAVVSGADSSIAGSVRLRWYDLGPPEGSSSGEPAFDASLDVAPLDAWVRDVLTANWITIADEDAVVGVGLRLDFATRLARLDATIEADSVQTNYASEQIPEFSAAIDLVE